MGKHIDNRHERKTFEQEKLKERSKIRRSNAYYDEDDGRYEEWSYSKKTNRKKYIKNQSNRKIRRTDNIPAGKSQYQKLYDYWWELD